MIRQRAHRPGDPDKSSWNDAGFRGSFPAGTFAKQARGQGRPSGMAGDQPAIYRGIDISTLEGEQEQVLEIRTRAVIKLPSRARWRPGLRAESATAG